MIDCYRTPEDLHNWRRSQQEAARRRIAADPRFYNGDLYTTMIERNVAEARDRLAGVIDRAWMHHRIERLQRIPLGHPGSLFRANGRRK